MRKYRIWTAAALALLLLVRLVPGFGAAWGESISRPLLELLRAFGDHLPFVLLEWMGLAASIFLGTSLIFRRFLRSLCCILLCLLSTYLAIWYPLYCAPASARTAEAAQISALCEHLIDELNAGVPDFSAVPGLPAKTARFPGWMRAFNVNGFCSFFTGEAIVSPELPASVLPFVAMHERMHLEGVAGEGAANIAAWEACMERGGAYADSARLWALRYGMGILKRTCQSLYADCMQRMDADTWCVFRESGGSYNPAKPSALTMALCRLLGIEQQVQDYEILAPYLAAGLQQ